MPEDFRTKEDGVPPKHGINRMRNPFVLPTHGVLGRAGVIHSQVHLYASRDNSDDSIVHKPAEPKMVCRFSRYLRSWGWKWGWNAFC